MPGDDFEKLSDEKLLQFVKNSNTQAFDELYRRHWHLLFRTADNILLDAEAARDVVQDIFISFWVKRHERDIRNVGGYLRQSVKLKCFEHLRTGKINQQALDRIKNLGFARDTEEKIDFLEVHQTFEKHLNELPAKCREIFRMSRFEDLSNKEIALRLNISVKAVEYHITRALKHIRRSMGDYAPSLLFFLLY